MAKNPVRILAPGGCAAQDVVQAARSAAIESLKKARISPDQAETLATRIAMACFAGLNRNGEQAVARAIREIAGQYIAANQGAKKTGIDNVIVQYGLDMPPISRYGSSPGAMRIPAVEMQIQTRRIIPTRDHRAVQKPTKNN